MTSVGGTADPGGMDLRQLLAGEHLSLVAAAVAAGNSPAILWTDDPGQPRSVLLWDGGHCAYLGGPVDPAGIGAWRSMLGDLLVPAARSRGITVLKVYPGSGATVRPAVAVTAGYRSVERERVFLRGPATPAGSRFAQRPRPEGGSGWQLSEINQDEAALAGLAGFPAVAAEIGSCWTSRTAFRRSGFGYCAHDSSSVLGWCTAEYVSAGRCGAGIETVEVYQGRGIATAMARAFVAACASRGLTPHWDSWADNSASLRVAGNAGFTPVERYPILLTSLV